MSSDPKPGRKRRQKLEPIDWRELAADPVLKGNMSTLFRRPAGERSDEVFSEGALLEIAKRNSTLEKLASPKVSSPASASPEDLPAGELSEPASPKSAENSLMDSKLGHDNHSSSESASPEVTSSEVSSPEDTFSELTAQPRDSSQPVSTDVSSPELSSPEDSFRGTDQPKDLPPQPTPTIQGSNDLSSPEVSLPADSPSESTIQPVILPLQPASSEAAIDASNSSPEVSSPELSSPEDSSKATAQSQDAPHPTPNIQTSGDLSAPEVSSPEAVARSAQKRRVFFAGDRMQSALSPLENDCYLWLWSHAAPVEPDRRRISFKMAVLAQALNISERAATDLVRRMQNKYCLEPDDSWFPGKQSGKGFYLYSMRRILARRRAQGLEWAIKGGRGIELISEAEARRIQALRVAETPMPVYGSEQPDGELTNSPEATSPED